MRLTVLPVILFPLLACQPEAPADAAETDTRPPEATACKPDSYAAFLGRPGSEVSLPEGTLYRVIGPGDMITMDQRAERVNFETDAAGVVRRIRCG